LASFLPRQQSLFSIPQQSPMPQYQAPSFSFVQPRHTGFSGGSNPLSLFKPMGHAPPTPFSLSAPSFSSRPALSFSSPPAPSFGSPPPPPLPAAVVHASPSVAPSGGVQAISAQRQAINQVLERGESNATLQQDAENLSAKSKEFYKQAKQANTGPIGGLFGGWGGAGSDVQHTVQPQAPVQAIQVQQQAQQQPSTNPFASPPKSNAPPTGQTQSSVNPFSKPAYTSPFASANAGSAPSPFGSTPASTPSTGFGSAVSTGGLFGNASAFGTAPAASPFQPQATGGGLFGSTSVSDTKRAPSLFGSAASSSSFFGSAPTTAPSAGLGSAAPTGGVFGNASAFGAAPAASPFQARATGSGQSLFGAAPAPARAAGGSEDELALLLYELVALQTFDGYWEWSGELFSLIGISEATAESEVCAGGFAREVSATALAVAFCEERLGSLKGSWELVVEKARGWLGQDGDAAIGRARGVLGR